MVLRTLLSQYLQAGFTNIQWLMRFRTSMSCESFRLHVLQHLGLCHTPYVLLFCALDKLPAKCKTELFDNPLALHVGAVFVSRTQQGLQGQVVVPTWMADFKKSVWHLCNSNIITKQSSVTMAGVGGHIDYTPICTLVQNLNGYCSMSAGHFARGYLNSDKQWSDLKVLASMDDGDVWMSKLKPANVAVCPTIRQLDFTTHLKRPANST